ncbi:unnamed protein product [Calicophoron daubneyi]|uniref:ATP-dependent RNA helicase DHX36 n=1 Tax=Calicophoron daubneyi TaxID=300641 RepID=A0AAV2TNF5_CALDB
MDLTGMNLLDAVQTVNRVKLSGFPGFVCVPSTQSRSQYQQSQQSSSHMSLDGSNKISSQLSRARSPITGFADPMISGGERLVRCPELDRMLHHQFEAQQSSDGYLSMLQNRIKLPTYFKKNEILSAIQSNQVVLLSGESGCGKTTQVPQYILEHEVSRMNGSVTRIVVTQPRRISAISVAERVAAERGETIGQTVGFQNVSHIIVDEVHEREYLSDFLLALLKRIMLFRKDLRVILMSATLNVEKLSAYFGNCCKLKVVGRMFPVQEYFLEDCLRLSNFWLPIATMKKLQGAQFRYMVRRFMLAGLLALKARRVSKKPNKDLLTWLDSQTGLSDNAREILRSVDEDAYPRVDLVIHMIDYVLRTTQYGAVLVFVPEIGAIKDVIRGLRKRDPAKYGEDSSQVRIFPLHSHVSIGRQRALFEVPPNGVRKVILSTNIAETSVTIEDVVYVIDCGRIKVRDYDANLNSYILAPVLVSQANAAQRCGRAGRTQPGVCYHLFSSYVYNKAMPKFLTPELMRMRLEDVVLNIKLLDLGTVSTVLASCMDPPSNDAIERTLFFLIDIMAISCLHKKTLNFYHESGGQETKIILKKSARKALRNRLKRASSAYSTGNPTELNAVINIGQTPACGIPGNKERLTLLGLHLARLPLDPQCAKLLILGALFGCLEPALSVAACLTCGDPFEIPLEKESEARRARVELSQNSLSDHWVYVQVIQNYRELSSPVERRKFCEEYFICENMVKDVLRLVNDYATLLYEKKFIHSPDPSDERENKNKDNLAVFRAILCGALRPNLVTVNQRTKYILAIGERQVLRPRPLLRPREGKVAFDLRSVNASVWPASTFWTVYFWKQMTDNTTMPTVMDTTIIPLRPIVLFSRSIEASEFHDYIYSVDGWVHILASPALSLIKDLRECLNRFLDSKYMHPSPTNWDPESTEGRLMQTLVDVFTSEPLPAVETHEKKRHMDHSAFSGPSAKSSKSGDESSDAEDEEISDASTMED